MFKTPVSILEELMVTKRQASPDYSVEIHSDGIQGILFKCTVTVGSIQASGYASRKKDAKQHAAKNVLEMLGYRSEVMSDALGSSNSKPQNPNGCIKRIPLTNYVGKLNEIANTYQKPYPIYHEEPVPIRGKFLTRCSFLQYVCDGYGYNKKDSKQDAARNMLEILKDADLTKVALSIQHLHLENKTKIAALTQEVLKNYNESNVSAAKSTTLPPIVPPTIPTLKINKMSTEDVKMELKKYGYSYTMEVFQENPCIMMMKINDTKAIIMGSGNNKSEALDDLFDIISIMFSHGCSLKAEL